MPAHQIPDLILPVTGVVEMVNDAVVHYSKEIPLWAIQEKSVQVYGIIAFGVPGPLNCWIEIAPYPLALGAFYTILGVPVALVATGSVPILWAAHSEYARLAVQAPGGGAAAFWTVFATFSGKGP